MFWGVGTGTCSSHFPFNFVKNRDICRECLELEMDVENSEHVYWWKEPLNLANVINIELHSRLDDLDGGVSYAGVYRDNI